MEVPHQDEKIRSESSMARMGILRGFCRTASVHGLAYSLLTKSISRRIIWCLLFVSCTAGLVFSLYLTIVDYSKTKTISIDTIEELDTHSMPSLTICPRQGFSLIKANEDKNIKEWFQKTKNRTSTTGWNISFEDVLTLSATEKEQFRFRFLATDSWRLNGTDVILSCFYGGQSCQYGKYPLPGEKNCIVINSPQDKWRYFNNQNIITLLLQGLPSNDNFPLDPSEGEGFLVQMSEKGAFADGSKGFAVEPGTLTHAVVSETKITFDDDWPLSRLKCSKDRLVHFWKYSVDGCIKDCQLNEFEYKCGCRWPYFEGRSHLPACTFIEYNFCINNLTGVAKPACICNQPCAETKYSPKVTQTRLNLAIMKDKYPILYRHVTEAEAETKIRTRVAVLNIVMDAGTQRSMIKEPKRTLPIILGTIGGLLALFLGCSFVTLLELIDLICRLIGESCDPPEHNGDLNKPQTNGIKKRGVNSWSNRSSVMEY